MDDGFGPVPTFFRVAVYVIAGFPVLIGLVAVVRGAVQARRELRLARTGSRAPGVVVDNQIHSGLEGQVSFAPVVAYRSADGREHRVAVAGRRASRSYVAGTDVEVTYDPQRPELVALGRPGLATWSTVPLGLGFVAFGLVVLAIFSTFTEGVLAPWPDLPGDAGDSLPPDAPLPPEFADPGQLPG